MDTPLAVTDAGRGRSYVAFKWQCAAAQRMLQADMARRAAFALPARADRYRLPKKRRSVISLHAFI